MWLYRTLPRGMEESGDEVDRDLKLNCENTFCDWGDPKDRVWTRGALYEELKMLCFFFFFFQDDEVGSVVLGFGVMWLWPHGLIIETNGMLVVGT